MRCLLLFFSACSSKSRGRLRFSVSSSPPPPSLGSQFRAYQILTMVLASFFLSGLLLASQAAASPAPYHQTDDHITIRAPQSRKCSATTFTNITGFVLTEYLVDTVEVASTDGSPAQTQTIGTFGVWNPGTGDTYRLARIPISAGGGTWSVCRAGETPLPSQLERCQYLIERGGQRGRIGFRFQWLCDGADASKPYVLHFCFFCFDFLLSYFLFSFLTASIPVAWL